MNLIELMIVIYKAYAINPGMEVRIYDHESGTDLPAKSAGEIDGVFVIES